MVRGWWVRAKLTLEPRSSSQSCPRVQPDGAGVWSLHGARSEGVPRAARVTTHRAADPRPWPPPGGSAREGNHPTSSHCKPSEATHYAAAVDRSPGNRPSPRARRRRLVLPPMRGSVSGEAWSFTGRQTPLRIRHPGLVFRPPRQNSPRPQAMGVGSSASPVEAPPCAGLCRSGAEDMFHERQTQDVVFARRLICRVERAWKGVKALARPAGRSPKPRGLDALERPTLSRPGEP